MLFKGGRSHCRKIFCCLQESYFGNATFGARLSMRRVSDRRFSSSYDSIDRFRNEEFSWQTAYKIFIRSIKNWLETAARFFKFLTVFNLYWETEMKLIHTALLAGAAVLGLAALAPSFADKSQAIHRMTVSLPSGGTEIITYTGDVAPKVTFLGTPFEVAWSEPTVLFPNFVAFDRLAEDMDRQMQILWRQSESAAGLTDGGLPQASDVTLGTSAYTLISHSYGDQFCSRVTEITAPADGGEPKVVSRTSGNCEASPAGSPPSPPSGAAGAKPIAIHTAIPAMTVPRTVL